MYAQIVSDLEGQELLTGEMASKLAASRSVGYMDGMKIEGGHLLDALGSYGSFIDNQSSES